MFFAQKPVPPHGIFVLHSGISQTREDPKSRTLNSGPQYSYGVGCRTLRWINLLDPPRGL